MQRKLAAILFTDMVGYTSLMARDESLAARLRARHRAVLQEFHEKYDGEILQYFGDGTLSIFSSAVHAVNCAISIQQALQQGPDKVDLRIGIHTGEVVWDEEGIYGNAVNIASRLESMAVPGGVLVSRQLRDELRNQAVLKFRSDGLFELKNVPEPMEVFTVVAPGLPESAVGSNSGKGWKLEQTRSGGDTANDGRDQQTKPAIAILPFADLSPEKDKEYLCEGLADEIITDLSALKNIRVISRHSSTQLKGTSLSAVKIGDKLGVRYLLTGSIRQSGKRLRITAQLVDAVSEDQLWARKFDGDQVDIFDLQESISKEVVIALNVRVDEEQPRDLSRRPIQDVQVFEVYLKARQEIFKMNADSLNRAEALIEEATRLIGPNATILATKGLVHLMYIMLGIQPDRSHLGVAQQCLEAILQLEGESVNSLFLQGLLQYKATHIQDAVISLKQVLIREPGHRDAHLYLGLMYLLAGRPDQARVKLDSLVAIDPLTSVNHIMPGYALACQGRFHEAVPFYRKALNMEPTNPFLILMMGLVPARVLPPSEVIPILQLLQPQAEFHIFGRVGRFLRLALEGQRSEALEAGGDARLQQEARWDEHAAWWMASTYAYLDAREPAMDWLQVSIDLGNFNYPLFALHDPFLENIRREERFRTQMMAVKERWEKFEG